jgi:uncharacterized protein
MPIPVMDPTLLVKLANTRMPYGKYSGRLLIDLPDRYVVWYAQKGYPDGELGKLLSLLNTIKENGLEGLIRPLTKKSSNTPVF